MTTFRHIASMSELTQAERDEVALYMSICTENGFTLLKHVNQWIDAHRQWHKFRTIRKMNTHGEDEDLVEVRGIRPDYYHYVCRQLGIPPGPGRRYRRSRDWTESDE